MRLRLVTLTLGAALAATPHLAAAPQDSNAPKSSEHIIETAVLRPARSTTIVNPMTGRSEIHSIAEEGTSVEKGDLVCVIDTSAIEEQVAALTIALQGAKAEVMRTESQLESSRRALLAGKVKREGQLRLAKLALAAWQEGEFPLRVTEREGEIAIAQAEINRANAAAEEAASRLEELSAAVDLTRAESALRLATMKLKHLQQYENARQTTALEHQIEVLSVQDQSGEVDAGARRDALTADMAAAKVRLEQLAEELKRARARLKEGQIPAPHAGTVIHVSTAGRRALAERLQPGAQVRERQPLLEIHDLSQFLAIAHVTPDAARHVTPGETMEVIVDALPDRTYSATTTAVIQKDDEPETVELWLQLESTPDRSLRPGMTAIVKIPVE